MIVSQYERWLNYDLDDKDLKEELLSVEGKPEEINDRFYQDLEFGTGGLRGVIGAGTNRMNVYTVRKATQGLANYLVKHNKEGKELSVAIAHDSRNKGVLFARESAAVLAEAGINPDTRVKDLTEDELSKIREIIDRDYTVEGDLRRQIALDIKRLIEIGCYRGLRHRRGLPVRGQNTKNNARTRKGPKRTIAGKKK